MSLQSTARGLNQLGSRLENERKRLGWSRGEMANRGDVSRASQRLYELNERLPPIQYLVKLGLQGVDFDYLLYANKSEPEIPTSGELSEAVVASTFALVWEITQRDETQIRTKTDAQELFLSLLRQIRLAESPTGHSDQIHKEEPLIHNHEPQLSN